MSRPSYTRPSLSLGLPGHAEIYAEMKRRLRASQVVDTDGQTRTPLATLSATELSDPTLALLDAWSATADIVAFYQDRLLNEGYLTTAVEKRSLDILGRSVGFAAPAFIAATAPIGVIVPESVVRSVDLPAGSALRTTPSTPGEMPQTFETFTALTATAEKSRFRPRQTRPPELPLDARGTILKGINLGLSVGDALLMVLPAAEKQGARWLILTIIAVSTNPTLDYTRVNWDGELNTLWVAAGWPTLTPDLAKLLEIYAMQQTLRLFGYNAPEWKKQPFAVQIANTPSGHNPFEYDDWPDFPIDYERLPLQSAYSKIVPGSKLVIDNPDVQIYTSVKAAELTTATRYGLSSQVTRIVPADDITPARIDIGSRLDPERTGHSATLLPDGVTILILGGNSNAGAVRNIELFDIPTQKLRLSTAILDEPRIDHSATLVGDAVLVFGGQAGPGESWPATVLTFTQVGNDVRMATVAKAADPIATTALGTPDPRIRAQHRATLLPGTTEVLISGGVAPPTGSEVGPQTLTSVVLCDIAGTIARAGDMVRARSGHSATWCPVIAPPAWPDPPPWDLPADAAAIVIAFGTDGTTSWNDVEVFDMTSRTMSRATFPWSPPPPPFVSRQIPPPPQLPAGRAFHGATAVADGILLTGGEFGDGTITDECWTVYCQAYRPPEGGASRADPGTGRSLPRYVPVPILAPAAAMLTPRARHATALDIAGVGAVGTVVVAGGTTARGRATDAVEQLVITSGAAPQPPPAPPNPTTRNSPDTEGSNTPPAPATIPGGAIFAPKAGALLPRPMSSMAECTISESRIFLCGGNDDTTVLDTAFIYELNASSFVQTAGLFFATLGSLAPSTTTALADGTLLLTGISGPNLDQSLAWTFDPATNLATQIIPPMKQPRVFGAATLLANGTVLLSGGSNGAFGSFSDTLEIYDPVRRSFQTVGTIHTPRRFHTATLLPDGSVLIFGGFPDSETVTNPEVFDASTMGIVELPCPTPNQLIYAHTATYLGNGYVLIAGGMDAFMSLPTGQCLIYNCFAGAFTLLCDALAFKRGWHAAILLSDPTGHADDGTSASHPIRVLLTGGYVQHAVQAQIAPSASAEIFDFATLSFTSIDDMQAARALHAMIGTPDDGVLIIGGDGDVRVAAPSSAEFYRPAVNPKNGLTTAPAFSGWTMLPVITPDANEGSWFSYTTVGYAPGFGIYFFGRPLADPLGTIPTTATGVRYVTPPAVTGATPRNTLIYAQSVQARLAPPIDTRPIALNALEVEGIIPSLVPGDRLLVTGLAPFAICTGVMGVIGSSIILPTGSPVLAHGHDGTNWRVTLMSGDDAIVGPVAPSAPPPIAPVKPKPGAAPAPPTLDYLAGDGGNIGNVPAAFVKTLPRPSQAEVAIVASITTTADGSLTTITFESALERCYDRTTMEIYGNVVDVTQGQTTTGEILGNGDASVGFQAFSLAKVPLTRVTDPVGQIVDTLDVRIDNVPWTRVGSLADAGPIDKCYTLAVDTFGRGRVTFGDGIRGARLPTGHSNVTASYRIGAGAGGDIPARSLTKPPAHSPDISAVVSPIAASGGVGAVLPAPRRVLIPNSTRGLDRIVAPDDVLSFVQGFADIARAVVAALPQDPPALVVSIAGPDGVRPDPEWPSFLSLLNAMRRAAPPAYAIRSSATRLDRGDVLSTRLDIALAPYEPTYFNVGYTLTCKVGTKPKLVRDAADAALRARYVFANQDFGQPVRLTEIQQLLRTVDGVASAEVDLLAYTLADPGDSVSTLVPVLAAQSAKIVDGRVVGAQILLLNPLVGGIQRPEGDGS